jgi:chaperonin GroEL
MTSAKQIVYEQDARERIRAGVRQLARAVKVTLGPRGRNVVIQRAFGDPHVTKDGVSVAREIALKDPYENIGAQMVRQVASKTANVAGDGTTTATVLAEAIFEEGLKNVTAGASPIAIKNGIAMAVEAITAKLEEMKKPVKGSTEIAQIGTIASNNDAEIGQQIASAMERVGKDGVITVEEGNTIDTVVEWVEGLQFDKGYMSPHFVSDPENGIAALDNPFILIHEKKISSIKPMIPLLEKVQQSGRSLLIIAEDLEGDALGTLIVNKLRGVISVCAVKSPGFGDRRVAMLQDIASLVGATPILDDHSGVNLSNIQIEQLGEARRVVVERDATTIMDGGGDPDEIQSRITALKNDIGRSTSDYDKEKLQERLAKLSGGIAQINVGATTEAEMKEKKDRVDDALHATRAAVEGGILPGGGVSLLRCISVLDDLEINDDSVIGVQIVRRALEAPIRQIVKNAGGDGSIVVQKILDNDDFNFGYNAATGNYENLIEAGVIDPTKVVATSLQNAASISTLLLTTEAVVSEIPDENDNGGGGDPMGGMGGMMPGMM